MSYYFGKVLVVELDETVENPARETLAILFPISRLTLGQECPIIKW